VERYFFYFNTAMAIQRKVWAISLPPRMEKEIARLAKEEEKTKSELIRQALRMYQESKKKVPRR